MQCTISRSNMTVSERSVGFNLTTPTIMVVLVPLASRGITARTKKASEMKESKVSRPAVQPHYGL